ncbi:hypothetical protein SLS58_006751 [Diplodia intermedia]|uniref:Histidine acid phosphatase n=1 Tax=Diplodia intermedia TaxID=856260 RepID=A0ABR3TLR9_9PEZI
MTPKSALKRLASLALLAAILLATFFFSVFYFFLQVNSVDSSPQIPLSGQHSTTLESMSLAAALSLNSSVSGWHPPNSTWITDLNEVINGTGVHGFVFNGSQLPDGVPYGTYNWCNMPHVRASEYPRIASDEYQLEYVEVIHRHHKRTPYASNTFPVESYPWYCSDSGLFYSGAPLNPAGNASAHTYWSVYTDPSNPFSPTGFNGTCQFPQLTRGGLDDSWQHGRDLWGVYHDLLSFLPSDNPLSAMEFRVTDNVITSQVASMLIAGMFYSSQNPSQTTLLQGGPLPLKVQSPSIDSLEPTYPCPASAALLSLYGPGSNASPWLAHLAASRPLFAALDAVSGVPPSDAADSDSDSNADEWHRSWDHYFDNLSARLCHAKPLPCSNEEERKECVTASQAAAVFRLGQHEYSRLWRAAPESLPAAAAGYGVWVAELAANIRDAVAAAAATTNGRRGEGEGSGSGETQRRVRYRHNVAHDGSVARLLALLQVDVMVWPGMGAEVVFELYADRREEEAAAAASYVRVLWGGRVLRSSHPDLGALDMLDAHVLLAYLDGLVGRGASKVPGLCGLV